MIDEIPDDIIRLIINELDIYSYNAFIRSCKKVYNANCSIIEQQKKRFLIYEIKREGLRYWFQFKHGIKNGVEITHFSNKKIKTISFYKYNKLNGPYIEFNHQGYIKNIFNYENNLLIF